MVYLLLIFYTLLLGILAWQRFAWAMYFFILILPTYLIRFTIGPLPSTVLELTFGIIFLVWLLKYARKDITHIAQHVTSNRVFFISFFLFLISSVAGIFISNMWYYSLGQWRAYFLEPILFFVMLVGRARNLNAQNFILALVIATFPVSLVAILQKFFPGLYPPVLWDDKIFGRVTSFFTTPNAIPLFILPSLFLGMGLLLEKKNIKVLKNIGILGYWDIEYFIILISLISGFIALILSRSFGGILAMGAGLWVMMYFLYSKRLALVVAVVSLLLLSTTYSLLPSLKLTSMQNRFTLWKHSATYLTESPKNFIFGAGIRQYFRKVEKSYYNPKELERLIYPHNIIFNFWTEIGLFGVVGFLGLFASISLIAYRVSLRDKLLGAALLSALTVFFVHGLIDVPYFKNDLAFLFWIMVSIVIISAETEFGNVQK